MKKKKKSEIADQINALMTAKCLRQAGLAHEIGVSPSRISEWLAGKRAPSPEAYCRMAKLAAYPESLWFWGRAGIDQQAMLSTAETILKERRAPVIEGETFRVRRVRKTPHGLEEAGPPLPMPVQAIPHPLSTLCFVLEKEEVVVDMADAGAASLLPFWGQTVLMEIEPQPREEIWALPFIEGLFIGALYGPDERRLPGRRDWLALFLPLSGDNDLRSPHIVGLWIEATFEPSKPLIETEEQQIATWRDIKNRFIEDAKKAWPRSEGESDDVWVARAMELEKKKRSEGDIAMFLEGVAMMFGRHQQAASEMRLIPRCRVLGRVIAQLPLLATKADS